MDKRYMIFWNGETYPKEQVKLVTKDQFKDEFGFKKSDREILKGLHVGDTVTFNGDGLIITRVK